MDVNSIEDSELLYRVVRNSNPNGFINGKPTAALFMDDKGTSVERDGQRSEIEIIKKFRERFGKHQDFKTAVKISAGECRKIGTYPNPINNIRNVYHAEIHESSFQIEISLFKAMQLAEQCREVEL